LLQSRRIRAVLLALLIGNWVSGSPTFAQMDCNKQLEQAEEQYYQGHFDEAIQLAEACLTNRDLPESLEIRAHKIIAKASISKRHVDRAKDELRKILEIDPQVALDPDLEPPQVIRLFEEVRKEKGLEKPKPPTPRPSPETVQTKPEEKEKGWFARNWYLVAGGVAAGAAVAVLAGGGGGGNGGPPPPPAQLPSPPVFP
jgi:hypothetical protein